MMDYFQVAFALLAIVAIAAGVWFVILGLSIGFRMAILAIGGLYRAWRERA